MSYIYSIGESAGKGKEDKNGKERDHMSSKELFKDAQLAHQKHSEALGCWNEGNPKEVWKDEQGNLCVKYESGRWWHYKGLHTPNLIWW